MDMHIDVGPRHALDACCVLLGKLSTSAVILEYQPVDARTMDMLVDHADIVADIDPDERHAQ